LRKILPSIQSLYDQTMNGRRILKHPVFLTAAAMLFGFSMVAAVALPQNDLSTPPGGVVRHIELLHLAAGKPLAQGVMPFPVETPIERGDTLLRILTRMGIEDKAARQFLQSSADTAPLHRQLVPGRIVSAQLDAAGRLTRFFFPLNDGKNAILVEREAGDRFSAQQTPIQTETRWILKSGEIRYSLFGATDRAGIPDAIAIQMAEIFSGDIDFHRDLRAGDRFTLLYEVNYFQGQPLRSGRILSAEFENDGHVFQAFSFTDDDGHPGYYDADGKSLKKSFLRSPLAFSRVTSGFNPRRFHPIKKVWRAHKGVDYGAPIGTPVRATSDGVISFIGRQNGYGNFIVLNHRNGYQTAYAHMNGFAAGMKKGSRVSQGDVIGYVGQTGWATGPHLHYEFRVAGQAVDPLTVTQLPPPPLDAQDLARFRIQTQNRLTYLADFRAMPVAKFE
jgi:murein DD-endopeptidase MepM/ murein hydrolase activator NlpD